jgi:hypothetical protein
MSARILTLAVGFSVAGGAPLDAQSLFSSTGLGLPLEAVDARGRALGNFGLGLSGAGLLPSDPAASARIQFPNVMLVAQPIWADASDGAQTNYFRGTRFPLLSAAYPFGGGMVSIHFASVMDQDFRGDRESTLMLGGAPVVATDSFEQDGSVGSMNVGYARMITQETSVGLTVGRYTGAFDRTLVRTVESAAGGSAVQPYISAGSWTYSGYLVTGGVGARLIDIIYLSASATWSSSLNAEASATTEGADGSFHVPLQVRLGASAALTPGLTLSASTARADWSGVADDLSSGSAARATTAFGVGLELTQARLLGRRAPLRLGFRRAGLPFSVGSEDATERIFSGGVGLELNQTGEFVLASMDLALERGRRSAGAFTENFWRGTLSLRLAGL